MNSNLSNYFRIIAIFFFVGIIFFSFPYLCNGHDNHNHDHHDYEPPSYKYSREANIPASGIRNKPRKQMSITSIWIEALSSTLIISIAPFLILFFVPVNNRRDHGPLLKILLSFASGSLLGDAFLHLIPHALVPHSPLSLIHDHHSHVHDNNVGLWVLIGILVFLIVEKSVRLIKEDNVHLHLCNNNSEIKLLNDELTEKDSSKKEEEEENEDKTDDKLMDEDNKDSLSESDEEIKVAGYLNLAADFTHNFTDGLAIGASYLAGETVGLFTTITILFHEIPHEIGDFAVLVQSGCSKKKAMLLQLLTAFGAFCGTLVALISGGLDENKTSWVLPFTAGGFIYIATVSIIPDLLSNTKFVQSIKEIFALVTGVLMMVIASQFE